jgi:flagellin-like protein
MNFTRRRAVSPIIASLLLIAIAVAAGIIVYVYVNSLAGNLTGGGGNQETQQLQLQAYAFNVVKAGTTVGTGQVIDIDLQNVGSSSISISAIYVDGIALSEWGTSAGGAGTYGQYFAVSNSATSGCYALVPTSATFTIVNTVSSVDTGAATACAAAPAGTCGTSPVVFCVKASASGLTETGGATGTALAAQGTAQLVISAAGQACSPLTFPSCPATAGTSHTIKIVSATGGTAVFTVVAGRTG